MDFHYVKRRIGRYPPRTHSGDAKSIDQILEGVMRDVMMDAMTVLPIAATWSARSITMR